MPASGAGYRAEPPVIADAGVQFVGEASVLSAILGLLGATAEVPADAWGLVPGSADAAAIYDDLLARTNLNLAEVSKGVGDAGRALQGTATNYENAETSNTMTGG